jgi:hypothetical protein
MGGGVVPPNALTERFSCCSLSGSDFKSISPALSLEADQSELVGNPPDLDFSKFRCATIVKVSQKKPRPKFFFFGVILQFGVHPPPLKKNLITSLSSLYAP